MSHEISSEQQQSTKHQSQNVLTPKFKTQYCSYILEIHLISAVDHEWMNELESCDVKVKCSQGRMFVVKSIQTENTRPANQIYCFFPRARFAFQKERQGVSNVDTPEVAECTCVFVCVCVSVFVRECVSKWKMWFELRPANRCLLAARCFDSHVGPCTQWPPL